MKLKITLSIMLVLIGVGFFVKTNNLFSVNKERYAHITDADGYTDGVLEFSSLDSPAIQITGKKGVNDSGTLEIYQASINDLLDFLIYGDDSNQINNIINTSNMSHLFDLNVNVTEKGQKYDLPLSETGIFLAQIKKGNSTDQIFIIRSSFGSLATNTKDKIIIWNQDFKTLKSLQSEAKVTLYNLKKGKTVLDSSTTDSSSVASVSLKSSGDLIIVEANNSISLIPLNILQINSGYFWSSFRENIISKKYFIFTDRPIYKPGDTVNFKSIIRNDDDARYSIPNATINVEVTKSWTGKTIIYKDVLNIDPNQGFVGGTFVLPKNLSAGEYSISLKTDEDIKSNTSGGTIYFSVENYRKPEYQITATAEKIEAIRGDSIKINLKGEYYSGQALSNAQITYKVMLNSTYEPEFYFSDNSNHYGGWNGENVEEGTVNLDKNGNGTLTLSTGKYDFKGENKLIFVDFKYKDQTGNPASSGINIFTRSGNISVYRGGNYGGKINEKFEVPLSVKPNKAGVSLSQKIKIEVTRKWWEKYYIADKKYPQYDSKSELVGNYEIQSDSAGNSVFSFNPIAKGSYELKTELNDSLGNPIIKTFYIWINDSDGIDLDQPNNNSTLKLSLNKKSYEPEETVKINLNSELSSRDIFLSFERGYEDRYRIVRVDDKQRTFEEKLLSTDLPNIYVSAKSFTGDKFESSSQNISINTDSKKIIYKISTDKDKYAPGDQVTVNVLSTDVNGQPVKSNLALWAVDKAIYALADKNYGSILENFWNERFNNTQNANSLEGITIYSGSEMGGCFLPDTQILMANGSSKSIKDVKIGDKILTKLNDNSDTLIKTKVTAVHQIQDSGYLIINGILKVTSNHILFINNKWSMAGLANIGDSLLDKNGNNVKINSIEYLNLKTNVYNLTTYKYHTFFADNFYVHNDKGGGGSRTNIADTAYWNLSVNTDENGKAQANFKLPDNLTTWVVAAIGSNTETKVGEGSSEIKVSKDLVIRPVLPNVLSTGDYIKVSALVNNFSDKDINATVSIITDAGEITSPVSQKIKVAAGAFGEINWDLTVGEADRTANFEFKVIDKNNNSDGIVQKIDIRSLGYWQQKSEFKKNNLFFTFNNIDSVDSNKSKIELTLGSNLLGSLPSAMNYLVNYGYGCVEQTTSSLMAKLIAKKYPDIFSEALKNQSQKITIQDGIDKLQNMQNYNGGWSWWKDSESNIFVSAYVFMTLNQSKNLGYKVDEDMYQSAKDYLSNYVQNSDISKKVIGDFGLSFDGGRETITENLDQLENDLLSIAVITNIQSGLVDSSKNGLDLLVSRMQTSDIGNFWGASSPERFGSIEASTALAVQALIKSGKYADKVPSAVNYLIQSRTNDYWGNTFATLQSILAIAEYEKQQSYNQTNLTYQIKQSGNVIKNGNFSGKSKPIAVDITVPSSNGQSLEITKTGTGNLYANLNQKWWIKSNIGAKVNDKVEVTKTITNAQDGSYNLIPGDLALVTITIKFPEGNQDLHTGYAVIEDHLPSGLIPVNFIMLNEYGEEEGYNSDYYYTEYLSDGVIIPFYLYGNNFVTSYDYTYKARVISEGSFSQPPVFFTMMYRPDIWGRSDFSSITIGSDRKIYLSKIDIFQKYKILWISLTVLIIGGATFITRYVIKKRQTNNI